MQLTMSDIQPVGLCLVTEDLFDAKRYQKNFCDAILLRSKDKEMEGDITQLKRELLMNEKRFFDGHKAVIISNIDKIISMLNRYVQMDRRAVEDVMINGKLLMKKVIFAENFEQLAALEPTFKSKIHLPTYRLFLDSTKRM